MTVMDVMEQAPPGDTASDDIAALLEQADLARRTGDPAGAVAAYDQVLQSRPFYIEALLERTRLLRGLGRAREGLGSCLTVLERDLAHLDGRVELAATLRALGRTPEAEAIQAALVRDEPDGAEAWMGLGRLLAEQNHLPAAEAALRRAVALAPAMPEARLELARLLAARSEPAAAIDAFHDALALSPDDAGAHAGLARALMALGRLDEAADRVERALALDDEHVDAHLARAALRVMRGDLAGSWDDAEWRWHRPGAARPVLPGEPWEGGPIDGRSLLLFAERSIADTIQMARFLPFMAEMGAKITVAVHPSLVALFETIDGIAVVNGSQALPPTVEAELTASLLDLPRLLGVGLDDVPPGPYLSAPEAARRPIGAPPGTVLKVGMAWAGATDPAAQVPFAALLALAEVEGVALYALQHGPRAADALALGHPALVTDLSPTVNNFADIAGRIDQLDLVIAADSPTAHLAAAMGKPVWLLTAYGPDPRWMLERDDSPWYPTMRLLRQDAPGDWAAPIARAQALLRSMAADAIETAQAGAQASGPQTTLRIMLAAHLAAGDLFVDVEADEGTFTFDAAAHPSGDVHVLALEPRQADAEFLQDSLAIAGVPDGVVTVITAAVGDRSGSALVSKQPRHGRRVFAVPEWVPGRTEMVSLDAVLADHAEALERRVVMRLGQQGWEAEILDGLWEWLALGRVAVLLWEHRDGSAAAEIAAGNGYGLWRLPEGATEAVPFDGEPGPVLALAPGLEPAARYGGDDAWSPAAIADARGEAARLTAEGLDHHRAGRIPEAGRCYGRALVHDPFAPDANANLGVLLRLTGRLDAAVACGRRALVRGALAAASSNLGNALRDLGRFAEAEAAHLAALEQQPHNPEYLYNLALVRRDAGHAREAAALLEKVHAQWPDRPAVAFELAQSRLKAGDDEGGFAVLVGRRRLPLTDADLPVWDGSPPEGRTILVHDDGDVVDTLMLARYIPLLSAHGALVAVECVPELAPIMAALPGVETAVARGEPLPACDLRIGLTDLPRLVGDGRRVHDVPYLHPSAAVAGRVPGPLRVGLAWGRGPRSCPPAELLALAAQPGVSLVALGERGSMLPALGAGALVATADGVLADMVAGVDLVVGDPGAPEVHLAGAMARPAWVALPLGADWRWPDDRDDSPWYPTARVFRQSPDGSWHDAMGRMVRALSAAAATSRSG